MKNILIVILVVAVLIFGYLAFKPKTEVVSPDSVLTGQTGTTNNLNGNDYPPKQPSTQTQATAGWKTYSNSEYSFSFKYPPTWSISESNVIDRTGKVLGHNVDFIDDKTDTAFHVSYLVYGGEVYKSFLPQYKKTMTEIQVSGETAYQSSVLKSKDIKGNVYNPPERDLFVTFLGKNDTHSFAISMQTPGNSSETEMTQKFYLILQSFIK